jgi:uncharacterized membrane protein required for colicin V production
MHLSDGTAALIHKWTNSQSPYIPLISFALVFVGILAGVFFVAKMVEKFAEKSALSFVNKLLGGAIGALKYLLLLSVLFFVVDAIEKNIEIIPVKMKDKSLLYRPVSKIAPMIIPGMKNSAFGKGIAADSLLPKMPEGLKDSVGK